MKKIRLVLILILSAFTMFAAFAPAGASAADGDGDGAVRSVRSGQGTLFDDKDDFAPSWATLDPLSAPAGSDESDYIPLPTWGANGLELADTPQKTAAVLQVVILLTVLGLAPSILILGTSFLRIMIVMGFIRKALSTQTLPPDQVMVGLSLLLTFFIMWPTWEKSWNEGWMPYWRGELVEIEPGTIRRLNQSEAIDRVLKPQRAFMFACLEANEGREELFFFLGMYKGERFTLEQAAAMRYGDVPMVALVPAFVTGELRRAFWMGFLVYLPFLILDMVIASVLMSMGMMMLQPAMISLPFKLVLFVMIDGWKLLMEGLVSSFPPEIYENAFLLSGVT